MALSIAEANKQRARRSGLAPASNQVFRMGQDMAQPTSIKTVRSPKAQKIRRASGKAR